MAMKAGVPSARSRHDHLGQPQRHQYPDYKNARIDGRPATEVISDHPWFAEAFVPTVAKRGSAVIKARGASSAASAANAIVDSLHSASSPTQGDDWFSAGVVSDGGYGIPAGLIYSVPLRTADGKTLTVVNDVPIDEESRARLDASAAELQAERDAVKDLLGPAAEPDPPFPPRRPHRADVSDAVTRSAERLPERPGGGAGAGPGAGVEADDPAPRAGAVDDDGAGLGRLGGAAVAQGVEGVDADVELRGDLGREGPDVLARVLDPVDDRPPSCAGEVGPPPEGDGLRRDVQVGARATGSRSCRRSPRCPPWGDRAGRWGAAVDLDPHPGRVAGRGG
ncbi:MAG: hypothetical protein WKF75_17495 [Singulisphaera sp.]